MTMLLLDDAVRQYGDIPVNETATSGRPPARQTEEKRIPHAESFYDRKNG
jgi:hypothetical protein